MPVGPSVRFALRPGADPFGPTDARRTRYAYLAEVVLVLFFVPVRFDPPGLFPGQVARYWTFLVLAPASAGVGPAEPLRRTGCSCR